MNPVNIGGVMVGDGYPTVFVAEVGTFFNQDIEMAKEYLHQVIKAGAPIFKTEILHDTDICLDTDLIHEFNHASGRTKEVYRSLIERKTVSFSQYEELFSICKQNNIPFIASVYDIDGIDFFVSVGGAALKIARNNINNVPLIRHAAKTGLPIIFDAGIVYLDEIAYAVRLVQQEGNSDVIINHHPGANPAAASQHNMVVMQKYKEFFDVPVGLSCHYVGDEILYLAVGMGANLLEKGVVDDPTRNDQDLISAARLDEMTEIIEKVNNCWEAIGKHPVVHKEPRDLSTRTGMTAKYSIKKGEPMGLHNVRFSWPPLGISSEHWDLINGKVSNRDLNPMETINWKDVEFES